MSRMNITAAHTAMRFAPTTPEAAAHHYLVTYADTDAGGVLHHAKYIELAETGRHWWLKHHDLSFRGLMQSHSAAFVVHQLEGRYLAPIALEDELDIHTLLSRIDQAGLSWQTRIYRQQQCCAVLYTEMVCVHSVHKTVQSVPAALIQQLTPAVATAQALATAPLRPRPSRRNRMAALRQDVQATIDTASRRDTAIDAVSTVAAGKIAISPTATEYSL